MKCARHTFMVFLFSIFLIAAPTGLCQTAETAPSPEAVLLQAKKVVIAGKVGQVMHWYITGNPSVEKARERLRKELTKWGRFTIVDDPAAADLLLVLEEGQRPFALGGNRPTSTLYVYRGGARVTRGDVPLWERSEGAGMFQGSGAAKVVARLHTYLEELEKTASHRQPPVAHPQAEEPAKPALADSATIEQELRAKAPPSRTTRYVNPMETIARARTVAVRAIGPGGKTSTLEKVLGWPATATYASTTRAKEQVIAALNTWGRLRTVEQPGEADLILVVAEWDEVLSRYGPGTTHWTMSGLEVYDARGGGPDRAAPPLWFSGRLINRTKDLVGYLRADLDLSQHADGVAPTASPNRSYKNAVDDVTRMGKEKDAERRARARGRAVAEFRESLRQDPGYAPAHSGLGELLLELGHHQAAAYEFQQALRLAPDSHDTALKLAGALTEMKDFDAAAVAMREAIRVQPRNPEDHVLLGRLLYVQSDFDGAVAEYREALQLRPGDPGTQMALGLVLARKGDFAGSAAACREALRLDPQNAEAHHNLGVNLQQQGDFAAAETAFREAVRLAPNTALMHFSLGRLLHAQGKYDEAIAELRRSVELEPRWWNPHSDLGRVLAGSDRFEEAIAEHHKAIELAPEEKLAHNDFGCTLLDKGEVDRAEAEFRQALQLDPTFAFTYFHLGRALERKGDLLAAHQAFEEAHRLLPENEEIRKKVERMEPKQVVAGPGPEK